jgi:hypothetical protein
VDDLQIPTLISLYKFVPLTSCDDKRSFSAYKLIILSDRTNFTPEHLEQYLICNCEQIKWFFVNFKCQNKYFLHTYFEFLVPDFPILVPDLPFFISFTKQRIVKTRSNWIKHKHGKWTIKEWSVLGAKKVMHQNVWSIISPDYEMINNYVHLPCFIQFDLVLTILCFVKLTYGVNNKCEMYLDVMLSEHAILIYWCLMLV